MRYPSDPTETKWLIGQEWKFSNGRSGLILIGRKFDQEWLSKKEFRFIEVGIDLLFGFEGSDPEGAKARGGGRNRIDPVIMMERTHLYPCRTQ